MHHTQKTFLLIGVAVVLIGTAMLLFITRNTANAPIEQSSQVPITPVAIQNSTTDNSLGAQILEKSQNPIEGRVPDTAPETNPIKDVYKNPFE